MCRLNLKFKMLGEMMVTLVGLWHCSYEGNGHPYEECGREFDEKKGGSMHHLFSILAVNFKILAEVSV